MPTMSEFLKKGTSAKGNGLLTQAPPNTGAAGTASRPARGRESTARPTTRSTGTASRSRTARPRSTRACSRSESIAQSAERSGLKVAQVEWAGGRNATIDGPTIDFQSFFSGRGVATNFIGKAGDALFDNAANIAAFGLQFDHPAGYAGQAPYAAAAPTAASGWTGSLPQTYSPAREMHLRVIDFGVDKYGLNAWIYDSTNDGKANYDKVLFSRTKSAADAVGTLKKGEWADVKVKIADGASAGLTAGMLVKVEELTPDLSRVRLFHTSVSRAIASWPSWPGESGFSGDFAEYLAQKFPTSTAADFAILEAGVTSEETYTEQGLYWKTGHLPMLEYVVKTYKPDLLLAGMPTTDEFQHQFLGLVSPKLPGGAANPAYDDVDLNGKPDGRVAAREGFIRTAYKEADEVLTRARELMGKDPTTFVASDHGFAPQFLAIDGSQPLVEMGLLSKPQTSNCRPATGETIGKAKACWAGGTVQIYLNLAGRDPVGGGFQQVAAADAAGTVAAIKAKYQGLVDTKDWTHDGQPEGWKMIDRVFTKAEARYIPNGPSSTADMAHPTRTGDVIAFSFPPYQFDAETPGHAGRAVPVLRAARLRPRRPGPPRERQHARDVPRRWRGDREGRGLGTDDRPGADARVHARDRRAAAEPGTRPARRGQGRQRVQAALDHRAERLPRPARADDAGEHALRRARAERRRWRLPRDDVRRGLCGAAEAGPPAGGGRQRRRVAAELGPARGHARDRCRERVGARRHVVRQPRVRLRRRAAAEAAGAGEVPVPGDEHRREVDRQGALVGDALQGVHDRRRQGRRHRRRAEEHSGARLRGCDGRPRVPRRGVPDQGRVGAPARGRCTCPGRRHPPGNQHR